MRNNSWVRHLTISNIKKHGKRNIFSIVSLVIGLTSSFLIIGFSTNADKSVIEESYHQFDYGSLTITKENKVESTNGGLSIVRNSRPLKEDINNLKKELINYEIDLNLDALVPPYSTISYGKDILKDYTYQCVYSFLDNYVDRTLLVDGEYPYQDSLDCVLVNEKLNNDFKKKYRYSLIGKSLSIHYELESIFYSDDEFEPIIKDYFIYDKNVIVIGVVKDLAFLSTPKVYYSYIALYNYLFTVYMNNLSSFYGTNYSWIERISSSNNSEDISSYSYRLFLKDYKQVGKVNDTANSVAYPFVVDCPSLTRTTALLSLIDAATTGMELFLIISLLGTALIMGIVSFSFYNEDKKVIAILSCLGARMNDINDIYCLENMLIGVISFVISIIISPILQLIINLIVKKMTNFRNVISIPFLKFLNIPFSLPLIIFTGTIIISILSTLLPIIFSKKISLKEELKDE